MRKEKALFAMGIWVAVLPFLGFPNTWRKILFILSGAFIVFLSYRFRMAAKARARVVPVESEPNTMRPFIDNIR